MLRIIIPDVLRSPPLSLGELRLLNRLKAEERMAIEDQVRRAIGRTGLRPHQPAPRKTEPVIVKVNMSARKFPFLESLSTEIDKLGFEIEDEARSIVQKDIAEVRAHKTQVYGQVRTSLAGHREAIDDMKRSLDKVLSAIGGNSGDA